jgi:NAD(P)-dependent dehydrogenase (short-subunit alcohol dehydrogenase family)
VTGAPRPDRTAFVLGASADIGLALSRRLLDDGWRVVGAARDGGRLAALAGREGFHALTCDLADRASIAAMIEDFAALGLGWDLLVSAAGTMEPIGPFFELDFDAWERSVTVNAMAQLRVLHGLWRFRAGEPADVMLMAGGGTNNPFTNYSAYCVSKIALIKMCELLDDEEPALNIFIIGPGFVRTRIHDETIAAGARAGAGLDKTRAFLGGEGTPMDDIYAHMRWCMDQGRGVCGGRNFSTVHDAWRDGGRALSKALRNDPSAFRLRRAQPATSAD